MPAGYQGIPYSDLREELTLRKQELVDMLEEGIRYVLPSFAQQRMWLLDRFAPESPTYNIVNALRLSGPLDVEALHESFGR